MTCKSLQVKRGDTFRVVFTYKDANGAPIDLSGASARLQLWADGASTAALSVGTASGEITIDEGAGIVTMSVPYADMEEVDAGIYNCDLEITIESDRFSTETFAVEVVGDITV